MRWFKHMTNSWGNQKLSRLVDTCGIEGYGFWWRLLEIIAANTEKGAMPEVEYSVSHWCRLMGIHHHKFRKLLHAGEECGLYSLSTPALPQGYPHSNSGVTPKYDQSKYRVKIDNILKYRDEYSRKSGQTPESVRSKEQIQNKSKSIPPLTPPSGGNESLSLFSLDSVERDGVQGTCHHGEENTTDTGSQSKTDKKASKAKRKPKGADLPPYTVKFEACWKAYPNPSGKSPAWRAFLELDDAGQLPDDLLTRIQNRALEPDWLENAKDPKRLRFIPHMATWLHSRGWEDEGCFADEVPETSPEEERRIEIMGKYNFGMPLQGESADEIHAKNARMELELNAAGL